MNERHVSAGDLEQIRVFSPLPEATLAFLAGLMTVEDIGPGSYIFREGDAGSDLFVLLGGEVEVLKRTRRGPDTRVAILGPKDAFGEMSMIDEAPRSATVRTLGSIRLVRMTKDHLDALHQFDIRGYATMVRNIGRDLARRLRVADGILADFAATIAEDYSPRR